MKESDEMKIIRADTESRLLYLQKGNSRN